MNDQPTTTKPAPLRPMLDIRKVLGIVPFSLSTLMRMSRRGDFPKAYQISPGRVAWYRDEVEEWQRGLSADPIMKRRMARMTQRRSRHPKTSQPAA